jgi:tetratricopeptide (TPR) repeat protein
LHSYEQEGLGTTLHNLGITLLRLGALDEARRSFERSIKIFERFYGPGHPYVARSRAGLFQTFSPGSDEAQREMERFFSTGLMLFAPRSGAGEQQLNRALILARSRQTPAADVAHALSEALRAADEGGSAKNGARAELLLGATLGSQGAWESAQVHLERALRLARQADEPWLVAEAYRFLGDANLHGSHYEDARLNYEEAIRRYEKLSFKEKAARTRLLLLTMLLQLGRVQDIAPLLPALRGAIQAGLFPDAQTRTDAEQALRLAETMRGPQPKGETP